MLGEGDDAAHDFSAKVECTNGQQIIAERPMYFNYNGSGPGGTTWWGLSRDQIRVIQEALGHKNVATAHIYTHVVNGDARRAMSS